MKPSPIYSVHLNSTNTGSFTKLASPHIEEVKKRKEKRNLYSDFIIFMICPPLSVIWMLLLTLI